MPTVLDPVFKLSDTIVGFATDSVKINDVGIVERGAHEPSWSSAAQPTNRFSPIFGSTAVALHSRFQMAKDLHCHL